MTLFNTTTTKTGFMQCKSCSVIFPAYEQEHGLCKSCAGVERAMFQKVNGTMRFGERVQPEELAKRCSISVDKIYQWINEGRFN
jgi:hypothetical protein